MRSVKVFIVMTIAIVMLSLANSGSAYATTHNEKGKQKKSIITGAAVGAVVGAVFGGPKTALKLAAVGAGAGHLADKQHRHRVAVKHANAVKASRSHSNVKKHKYARKQK